jgi:hypothetical protein
MTGAPENVETEGGPAKEENITVAATASRATAETRK